VHAIAELNVLDRPAGLVETAVLKKNGPANGAAAGPEGRREPATLPVDVTVLHVPVLGEEVGAGGFVIVGADERIQVRLLFETLDDARQRAFVNRHVGIQKDQQIEPGRGRADIARAGRPAAPAGLQHPCSRLARHLN